jgi:hypothetical protein
MASGVVDPVEKRDRGNQPDDDADDGEQDEYDVHPLGMARRYFPKHAAVSAPARGHCVVEVRLVAGALAGMGGIRRAGAPGRRRSRCEHREIGFSPINLGLSAAAELCSPRMACMVLLALPSSLPSGGEQGPVSDESCGAGHAGPCSHQHRRVRACPWRSGRPHGHDGPRGTWHQPRGRTGGR